MHFAPSAEIFGVDGIIVLIVVVLVLFGSTQIPKLARSLGSAQRNSRRAWMRAPRPMTKVCRPRRLSRPRLQPR